MDAISYAESIKRIKAFAEQLRASTETILTRAALHRVLARPVHAQRPNPAAPLAALDGIAVDSLGIPDALIRLKKNQWQRINTGEVLPDPFNSVIRIEEVNWEDEIPVLMKKPELFHNVRRPGEDFQTGMLLLPESHRLQPQDLSLLLTAGCENVEVYGKPVVSFIPSGSELVLHPSEQTGGKVLESNSAMIAGLVESWGGTFRLQDPVPDDADDLAQMVRYCAGNSHIVLVSAGTSMGTRDLTAEVVGLLGKVHFHGVAMSPAKPVLFGEVNAVPVLGLPGYPVSAYLAAYLFLRYLVCAFSRVAWSPNQQVLISPEELPKRDVDSFHRVQIYDMDGHVYARKISGGAGSVFSLSQMDGWMHIPPDVEIKKRDGVRIDVIQDRAQNTIAVRGMSDPLFSKLFDLFRQSMPSHRLLFWQATAEDAFQSIVERNARLLTYKCPKDGSDIFPLLAGQLQERMLRYRLGTHTLGLAFPGMPPSEQIQNLPKGMRIALPTKHTGMWEQFLRQYELSASAFKAVIIDCDDSALMAPLRAGRWDAAFCDFSFLTPDQPRLGESLENVDLIIPESYTETPAIKKLIEILLSDEFGKWIQSVPGCVTGTRGLV